MKSPKVFTTFSSFFFRITMELKVNKQIIKIHIVIFSVSSLEPIMASNEEEVEYGNTFMRYWVFSRRMCRDTSQIALMQMYLENGRQHDDPPHIIALQAEFTQMLLDIAYLGVVSERREGKHKFVAPLCLHSDVQSEFVAELGKRYSVTITTTASVSTIHISWPSARTKALWHVVIAFLVIRRAVKKYMPIRVEQWLKPPNGWLYLKTKEEFAKKSELCQKKT